MFCVAVLVDNEAAHTGGGTQVAAHRWMGPWWEAAKRLGAVVCAGGHLYSAGGFGWVGLQFVAL